jgi:hypothetical protein
LPRHFLRCGPFDHLQAEGRTDPPEFFDHGGEKIKKTIPIPVIFKVPAPKVARQDLTPSPRQDLTPSPPTEEKLKLRNDDGRKDQPPAVKRQDTVGEFYPSPNPPFISHENGPPRKPGGPFLLCRIMGPALYMKLIDLEISTTQHVGQVSFFGTATFSIQLKGYAYRLMAKKSVTRSLLQSAVIVRFHLITSGIKE